MIDVNQLRKGVTFEMDNAIWRVLEYAHHKPGRGNATIRTKARNLRTGATVEHTFTSGDRVQDIRLDTRQAQFLYSDGDLYHFMDVETFEQVALNVGVLRDALPFLTEAMQLDVTEYDGQALEVELPLTVEMEVTESELAVKGDTATGATKNVHLSTGLQVQVPLFVSVGDFIRIDTRTGKYVARA
ncbi:MAG: elongation factor P [Anaerolineales bacterium]|jgi:elongation factor P|nr:elongation factor P [Gammaproteobacteria bacterium]MDP6792644.1 elongation factor P [Anaerolineales bacterium]